MNELRSFGITHEAVLQSIAKTQREAFVPAHLREQAYVDHALPIEEGQTISQPYVVARMTEALLGERKQLHRVLEIGTGSGYQAAVLSPLCDVVYTMERIQYLYEQAKACLAHLNYDNITCLYGDGHAGYVDAAPYEGIIVTAACEAVPLALLRQLSEEGGRLVAPVGMAHSQSLHLIEREGDEYKTAVLDSVIFVPLLKGNE